MKVLQRYFGGEILRAVFFVLFALLVLTSFFDLMKELAAVNKNGYLIKHAIYTVLLNIPGNAYDFLPIAVLIGTIYVLAQFASNSEFTIMRAASMSPWTAAKMLAKIALIFILLTYLLGEVIAPMATRMAKQISMSLASNLVSTEFRSGLWTKDVIRSEGTTGSVIGTRFLNVREVSPQRTLLGVKIYEFDTNFQLLRKINASKAVYIRSHVWQLSDVVETSFPKNLATEEMISSNTHKSETKELPSEITPDILSVLFTEVDRMSAFELASYTRHLAENKQSTERYEIAFWKKLTYPVSILVMMALALPFAYLHARDGGISLRIFSGIMLGMVFYLVNSLFAYLGQINTWPAIATALFPSLIFSLLAYAGLRFVQR
ncbi:LPS export ABC transporter permease LptG [Undibacterium fentianense]|uniref:LPS export ABC transporter permease LptG n=1 Tax=Undibacterium fentianense TaxID=2828728 RepID=A0A941E4X8_9BURK|nr:LPS export ABC transporter permease LptG [Undibacterium fentianense]MBR7801247.1 LPS export ABC transporter permease LptG [Undibacterium fentianense]